MLRHRATGLAALTIWCAASGCTTLQEIPRTEYTANPERRAVRVLTRDSLEYEFDYATFSTDTLVGFRRLDIEGSVAEYTSIALPLENVERLSSRRVDMYRTTLIGGVGILAVVGAGLAKNSNDNRDPNQGGVGPPRVP